MKPARTTRSSRATAAVLAVALLLGACGKSGSSATTASPNAVAASPIPTKVAAETGPVTVQGPALASLPDTGADPAKGQTPPVVTGTGFSGKKLTIGTKGRPYLLLFVAHWCPHCRKEVPLLAPWLRKGGVPKGIDVFTVATGTRPAYPNYPPSTWLRNAGWPTDVLADSTDAKAALAYGLTSYPFFVLVDGKGKVVERFAGERDIADIAQRLRAIT
ncbi:MAG: Redoxin [Acidimicrobiales bacterium]|nr:Redoxin [Acidimicrobiales bacterium]